MLKLAKFKFGGRDDLQDILDRFTQQLEERGYEATVSLRRRERATGPGPEAVASGLEFVEAISGETGAQMLAVTSNQTWSVDDKMRAIYSLDSSALGWTSER